MNNGAIRKVKARDIDSFNRGISFVLSCSYEEVSVCPMCHTALTPGTLATYYLSEDADNGKYKVFVINFCPKCRNVFICRYDAEGYGRLDCFSPPVSISPYNFQQHQFSKYIHDLSPGFVEIFSQSEQAESLGLTQICGPGYRKALEFLTKDYLCHIDPDHSDDIRKEFLGKSIDRIENKRIKTLSEKCAWIGNDETHYIRKHEDLGIEILRSFIDALVHFIESELAFEAAESIPYKK